jgi:hypothetical protein
MMICLAVVLTLATYGLLRFGYGELYQGYKIPPCSGSVPSFKAPHQLGNRWVGVATRFPYQYREHGFAEALTRKPGIVEYYEPFPNPGGFQANVACFFAGRHILPLVQLDPTKNVSLAAIVAGKYDGYLRAYATAVKQFHAPVALSFAHEMNGWWYSWGLSQRSPLAQYTTKPEAFIAAWRHIHDVFVSTGATNVRWVWTVRQNARFANHPDFPGIGKWWPGSKYVDWVGMDGYFRRPKQTFATVFGTQVTDIRKITDKPILISETAVRMSNPDASTQIHELFANVRGTRGLLGFVWFDLDAKKTHIRWNIDHNRAALAAVHAALRSPPPPAAR